MTSEARNILSGRSNGRKGVSMLTRCTRNEQLVPHLLVQVVRRRCGELTRHAIKKVRWTLYRPHILDRCTGISQQTYFWFAIVHCDSPLLEYSAPVVLGTENRCRLWLRSHLQVMLPRQ